MSTSTKLFLAVGVLVVVFLLFRRSSAAAAVPVPDGTRADPAISGVMGGGGGARLSLVVPSLTTTARPGTYVFGAHL